MAKFKLFRLTNESTHELNLYECIGYSERIKKRIDELSTNFDCIKIIKHIDYDTSLIIPNTTIFSIENVNDGLILTYIKNDVEKSLTVKKRDVPTIISYEYIIRCEEIKLIEISVEKIKNFYYYRDSDKIGYKLKRDEFLVKI